MLVLQNAGGDAWDVCAGNKSSLSGRVKTQCFKIKANTGGARWLQLARDRSLFSRGRRRIKAKDSEKNTTQPCAFKCAKTNLRLIFIYVIELNLSRPKKLLPPAAGWSILFISHLSSNTRIYGPRAEKFAGAPPASRCIRLYYDS